VTSALLATAPARGAPSALPLRLAQASPADSLRITVAPSISVRAASHAALQIRIAPANALPKNCFVRVRGLPPAVSLSEGYATTPGAWAVPLYALTSLQMIVPAGVTGRAELSISLVGEDGTLLADAKSVLVVEMEEGPRVVGNLRDLGRIIASCGQEGHECRREDRTRVVDRDLLRCGQAYGRRRYAHSFRKIHQLALEEVHRRDESTERKKRDQSPFDDTHCSGRRVLNSSIGVGSNARTVAIAP
jgi:hypothetical protein